MGVQYPAWGGDDEDLDVLVGNGIVIVGVLRAHPDAGALDDTRVGEDLGLDLSRRDIVAPMAEAVLDPVDEVQLAVLVDHPGVAGVEPTVAPRGGGRLRHPEITVVQPPRQVVPDHDLPERVRPDGFVELVDDADLAAGERLAARPVVGRVGGGRGEAHLGVAEAGTEPDTEAPLELPVLRDQRVHPGPDHGVVGVGRCGGLAEEEPADHEQHRMGDPMAADVVPEAAQAERVPQHHPQVELSGEAQSELAAGMKGRPAGEDRAVVISAGPVTGEYSFGDLLDAAPGLEDSFGRAGRAGGVDHGVGVVILGGLVGDGSGIGQEVVPGDHPPRQRRQRSRGVGDDDRPEPLKVGGDELESVEEPLGDDEDPGLSVIERIAEARPPVVRVDRDFRCPQPRRAW